MKSDTVKYKAPLTYYGGKQRDDRDSKDTFFYLDPPYPGTNQGHYQGYTYNDLEELIQILAAVRGKFALSNYPAEIISSYAHEYGWNISELTLKKDSVLSVDNTRQKTEILVTNYNISVPQQVSLFW